MTATDTSRVVVEKDERGASITFGEGADVAGILQSVTDRMRAEAHAPESLVTGEDPTEPFPLPKMIYGEYQKAPELKRIGEALLAHYAETTFLHIHQNLQGMPTFSWLWRAKGGNSGGNDVLAKIVQPSGLARFYAGVDFVIWVGWDNLVSREPQRWQVEALLYHELLHIGATEAINKVTGELLYEELKLKGHDAELFVEEITRYGMWQSSLLRVGEAFEQRMLFEQDGGA